MPFGACFTPKVLSGVNQAEDKEDKEKKGIEVKVIHFDPFSVFQAHFSRLFHISAIPYISAQRDCGVNSHPAVPF